MSPASSGAYNRFLLRPTRRTGEAGVAGRRVSSSSSAIAKYQDVVKENRIQAE
jgi:hypothetical protein